MRRSKAKLEALLESISTLDPTLRVRGVVQTPEVNEVSFPSAALPESELPPPLSGKPRTVLFLRPAVIPILIERRDPLAGAPIFLDSSNFSEDAKCEFYAVLARIPWLHKPIRTAIRRHGLNNKSVEQKARAATELQDRILRDDVERHKADLRKAGERQFEVKAYQAVARKHGFVFESKHWPDDPAAALDSAADALKKRLYRRRKRNK